MIPFRVLLGQVEEKKADGTIVRHKAGKIVKDHSFEDNHVLLMIADGHVERVKEVDGDPVSVLSVPKTDAQGNAVLDRKGKPQFEKEEALDGLSPVREAPAREAAQGAAIAQAGEAFSEAAEARAKAAWQSQHPGQNPEAEVELDPATGTPALGQGGVGAKS